MRCEKCGQEITTVLVNLFDREGADSFQEQPIEENENAVIIDTVQNWTGYEQSEEEMAETICCPYCKKFPFKSTEIQVFDVVRVVCFKADAEEESEEHQ